MELEENIGIRTPLKRNIKFLSKNQLNRNYDFRLRSSGNTLKFLLQKRKSQTNITKQYNGYIQKELNQELRKIIDFKL